MKKCNQCGKELPDTWCSDICLECSEANVRKIFKEHPDVKECFKQTIQDLKDELEDFELQRLWSGRN